MPFFNEFVFKNLFFRSYYVCQLKHYKLERDNQGKNSSPLDGTVFFDYGKTQRLLISLNQEGKFCCINIE